MAKQTRAQRAKSAEVWLLKNYPVCGPVHVRWVPRLAQDPSELHECSTQERASGIYAICVKDGQRFRIALSKLCCRTKSLTVETLIHEWAHLRTWGTIESNKNRKSDHDDQYWKEYGKIFRDYYEGAGWSEVRKSC